MPGIRRYLGGLLAVLAVLGASLALGVGPAREDPSPPARPGLADPDAAALVGGLPLAFEANAGHVDPDVRFVARTLGANVFLVSDGIVVSPSGGGGGGGAAVRLRFEGARQDAPAVGLSPLPGRTNVFLGDDSARWRTGVDTYAAVEYQQVYPGVDAVFYGTGRRLEHDFVVAPGADPGVIALGVEGGQALRIDPGGDLLVGDGVSLQAPRLYQVVDGAGTRRPVSGSYELRGPGRVGFRVGAYDPSLPLVIDPVLVSSSYIGGTSTDTGYAVAVDADGNAVITGYTESSDYPTVNPAQQGLTQSEGTRTDVFVTKVRPDGSSVVWSTYLGGRGRDVAFGLDVGKDGAVYVTGYTESPDFPVTNPFQRVGAGGSSDAFVTKLNAAGTAIEYSTYLGGKGSDIGSGIAVDQSGAALIVGATGSTDFPMERPIQRSLARADDIDAFVTKLQPSGNALAFSTYLGGAGDDHALDLTIDSEGNAYVVGDTRATNFPTQGPLQAAPGGAGTGVGGSFADAFVAKIENDGSGLVYSTYLGGSDSDKATDIALDSAGGAVVTGNTGSSNFPVTPNAVRAKKDGDFDAFVAKLRPDGAALTYATYLGGSGSDGGEAVVVDRAGSAYVSGATASPNFPTVRPFQGSRGGGFLDAFVTVLNPEGTSFVSSSYLGGRDDDQGAALALAPDGTLWMVGYTNSDDFPIAKPFQPGKGGGIGDAFITKIREEAPGEVATGAPATSQRERRVRLLVTVTGGLLLAAILQTLWLRRRPAPKPRWQPAPATPAGSPPSPTVTPRPYVPQRGRLESRTVDGKPFDPRSKGRVALDDEQLDEAAGATERWEDVSVSEDLWSPGDGDEYDESESEDDERERAGAGRAGGRPLRLAPAGAGAGRRGRDVAGARMTAPDLWDSDTPGEGRSRRSARAGAGGGGGDSWGGREERPPREELAPTDVWAMAPGPGTLVAEPSIDPDDVWVPAEALDWLRNGGSHPPVVTEPAAAPPSPGAFPRTAARVESMGGPTAPALPAPAAEAPAPAAAAPAIEAPVAAAPVVEAPAVEAPVEAAPPVIEAPIAGAPPPVVETPVVEAPPVSAAPPVVEALRQPEPEPVARREAAAPVIEVPVAEPAPEPQHELSIAELLAEDLPIPESALLPRPAKVDDPVDGRLSLAQLLDEEFATVTPTEQEQLQVQEVEEEDEDEEEYEEFPAPPPHLLRDLFVPDLDDPLVQATMAVEAQRLAEEQQDAEGDGDEPGEAP